MNAAEIASAYLRAAVLAVLFSAPILLVAPNAFAASSFPLIVDPVDESQRIALSGNTSGEVRPEFDRGPVDDAFPLNGIQLQLRRSPAQEPISSVATSSVATR